jgi:hypothetical protein
MPLRIMHIITAGINGEEFQGFIAIARYHKEDRYFDVKLLGTRGLILTP